MVSIRPITFTEEVDINKAITAIIDMENYKAITKTLITVEKALINDLKEINSKIKPNINKRSAISTIK